MNRLYLLSEIILSIPHKIKVRCLATISTWQPCHFNSQEKLKTMLMQKFGVTNKEYYGMLWYFWSGQLTLLFLVFFLI